MLTMIDGQILVGAAGAVTSSSGNLILSAEHVSTGIYKFNLKANLNAYISSSAMMLSPASGDSGISTIEGANDPDTLLSSNSAPSFTVKCLDDAGSLADPADGSTIVVSIFGRNSSSQY